MKIKGACRWWANFLHINTKWCHHRRSEFTATIWGQVNGIEICYWMHKVGRHWCEILIAHKGAQTSPIEADQLHQELEGHVPKPWEHCKIQEPTVRIYETYFWALVLWHIHRYPGILECEEVNGGSSHSKVCLQICNAWLHWGQWSHMSGCHSVRIKGPCCWEGIVSGNTAIYELQEPELRGGNNIKSLPIPMYPGKWQRLQPSDWEGGGGNTH